MKNKIIFFTPLLAIFLFANAKAQDDWNFTAQPKPKEKAGDCPVINAHDPELNIKWQYALGETQKGNIAYDVEFTPDSNLVYLYYSHYYQTDYLVCITQQGEELWRTIGLDNNYVGSQINLIGSDIYVSGYWEVSDTTVFGVNKYNREGKKLWSKILFEDIDNRKYLSEFKPYLIRVENNNMLGSFVDNGNYFVAKFDSSFNQVWIKRFSDFWNLENIYLFNVAYDLKNYYIFGSTHDTTYYVCLDAFGNFEKKGKLVNKHSNSTFLNGSFYFTGFNQDKDDFVRKFSSDFDLELEYIENDPSNQDAIYRAADIQVLPDNSILVFYDYEYYESSMEDMHTNFNVLHVSKYGECVSTLNLYGPYSQFSKKMLLTANNDIILFGYGYNYTHKKDMVYLGRIQLWDPVGVKQETQNRNAFQVYPNPAVDEIILEFPEAILSGYYIKIFTAGGQLIKTAQASQPQKAQVNITGLPRGMYIINVNTNNQNYNRIMIKK